jgi:hypothetical protein
MVIGNWLNGNYQLPVFVKMVRKIKYGKIAIVTFLTALIWIWADLALDERLTVSNVTISVPKSINPALLVNFKDTHDLLVPSISIGHVLLKGPASKIAEVQRMRNEGTLDLKLFLVPEQEAMTEPKPDGYPLNVLNFLKKNDSIKRLGLTVESCEPQEVIVNVIKLDKKSIPVQCSGENDTPLESESIVPATVEAYVPADRAITAKVRLTRREIDYARGNAIEKTPYIELPGGEIRDVATVVKIKMPPAEDVLRDYTIQAPKFGIALSLNLQGKYKVEVKNMPEVIGAILIKATPAAKQAYESMRYQVILQIDDEDIKAEEPRREIVYNFPEEFVRRNEIMLSQTPARARFSLVPLSPETPSE